MKGYCGRCTITLACIQTQWNSLFIGVRPGQSQPVPVHVMVILHHVFCGFIRGYEDDLKLGRRLALLHQLGVEITQQRGEVSTRRTPSGREIQTNHFIPERFLWIHQISFFIHQSSSCKHLDHRSGVPVHLDKVPNLLFKSQSVENTSTQCSLRTLASPFTVLLVFTNRFLFYWVRLMNINEAPWRSITDSLTAAIECKC